MRNKQIMSTIHDLPKDILKNLIEDDEDGVLRCLCKRFNEIACESISTLDMLCCHVKSLSKFVNLKHLTLISNKIPDLKGFGNLTSLEVVGSSKKGLIVLSEALPYLGNLSELTLKGVNMGVKEAKALSPALMTLSNLKKLNISDNNLGDEGLLELSPCFLRLETLDISHTIDKPSLRMPEIIDAMTNLKSLTTYGNQVKDEETANLLALSFSKLTNLEDLDILDKDFPYVVLKSLQTLEDLSLSVYYSDDEHEQEYGLDDIIDTDSDTVSD